MGCQHALPLPLPWSDLIPLLLLGWWRGPLALPVCSVPHVLAGQPRGLVFSALHAFCLAPRTPNPAERLPAAVKENKTPTSHRGTHSPAPKQDLDGGGR